jgi:putative folate metabolism gamma-glutamate ligase
VVVSPIRTKKLRAGEQTIFEVIGDYIAEFENRSILIITSKIVALCEGRVVPITSPSISKKEELVKQEADYYLPAAASKYGYHFTITNNTLISLSGIDESNSDGNYVLWPKDVQKTANEIREYLVRKFDFKEVGVLIVDSTCIPLRWGTMGLALAYSGFRALNNYIGQPDLFGRPFQVSQAGIANGLAAAAVVTMGEGTEQTPLAIINDVPFVKFQNRNPTKKELKLFYIDKKDDDLFAPFLNSVKWKKGRKKQ